MLFEPDSDFDLLLAVAGTALILIFALGPVAKELASPWGPMLAIAAGWPAIMNLLRYKRAPMGCAVVPLGILLWAGAFLAKLPIEAQGIAILLPNLPFYLWVSLLKPLLERRAALRAIAAIKASDDPAVWADHLTHVTPGVRHAAAERLSERSFEEVGTHLETGLQSPDAQIRGAAALAIRTLSERDHDAGVRWLRERAKDDEAGLPAAGLLAELDPKEGMALLKEGASAGLRLAVAEGVLHRQAEVSQGHLVAPALVEVLTQLESPELRNDAYYLSLRFHPEDPGFKTGLLQALRKRSGAPTVQELTLLGELGDQAQDALRCVEFVGSEDYDLAASAAEALETIVRVCDEIESARAKVLSDLEAGLRDLRSRHPQGENRLADQLAARMESVRGQLQPQ